MNRLTKSKAMQISGLSRHVFDKLLTEGTLVLHIADDDKKYGKTRIHLTLCSQTIMEVVLNSLSKTILCTPAVGQAMVT